MSTPSPDPLPEDLQELERTLTALKPEAMDSVSQARMTAAILHADATPEALDETSAAHNFPIRQAIWGSLTALAASIAIAFGLISNSAPLPAPSAAEVPAPILVDNTPLSNPIGVPEYATQVSAQSTLQNVVDEGIIQTESQRRMRQLRTFYLDTVSWTDPATESKLQLSYQREELFLIPVDAI